MKPERLVTFRLHGGVAVVSLNRPTRHNALTIELLEQLLKTLEQADCQSCAVVILRAEGRSFSTGGDLSGFQRHRETIGAYAQELVGLLNRVIVAIYTHPAAVVCAVQGQVTGGSLGLLLAADHVIMKREGSITRTRKLLNTNIEDLQQRLEAERENFVSQVQSRQALRGIDQFLRRKEHV